MVEAGRKLVMIVSNSLLLPTQRGIAVVVEEIQANKSVEKVSLESRTVGEAL